MGLQSKEIQVRGKRHVSAARSESKKPVDMLMGKPPSENTNKSPQMDSETVDYMLSQGVSFSVHRHGFGHYFLHSKEEILKYCTDPDQYIAEINGVTKKQLLAWVEYQSSHQQCLGNTKSGRQCRNWAYHNH
tara:strand:+ start:3883 stop:4278 length:396 start_codon:yes stop_codon:yes gene_type:complete